MTLNELNTKSILILGFGTEGQATYEFLRKRWPAKLLTAADRRTLVEFPEDIALRIQQDRALTLRFGPAYLDSLVPDSYQVIIKTPGMPASINQIVQARATGCILTSHSQIFLENYPHNKIIGVTGTKGKSTTSALIHHILTFAGLPAALVGNIGAPPLAILDGQSGDSYFVHEFSSHQLAEIESSPHIAVLLNIVPEHLDYYSSFEEYAAAKENITKFQGSGDFLVFNADYSIPNAIARRTKAVPIPFSTKSRPSPGCYLRGATIAWSSAGGEKEVLNSGDIPLPGKFNIQNVLAAAAAASLCGVEAGTIGEGIKRFRGLPHRLERVGTYNGVTFYDDSIATVPEATLAALEALGPDVQTLILGGHERNLDFSELGKQLPANVETVILFPPTGERIWEAIKLQSKTGTLPEPFFVDSMEEAVRIAYTRTGFGRICLLSPASPSFGLFKDYIERGETYKGFIREFSNSAGNR